MKINLNQIYKSLDEWRAERKISAEGQRQGYLRNIMEELGELSQALRGLEIESVRKTAEYEVINALCDIAVFTINAGEHIPCELKRTEMEWKKSSLDADYILKQLVEKCAEFSYFEWVDAPSFNIILINCAYLCEHYGFDFQKAMEETIKWEKDLSDEAKTKWYKPDYEKSRIEK